MSKTTEIRQAEEIEYIKANPLKYSFVDIYKAVLEMPKVMWQLFWYTYSSGTP
jgi:maltose/moltooligosaccharide transporter